MYRVEVRVANGQAALHSHGTQDEHGGQAEETHGKAKQVTQAFTTQIYQRHVAGIADEHRWAEEAGAQQVGEGQTGHQDAENRRPGAVLLLVDSKDEESQEVSHHTTQKHDDACCWFSISIHNESIIAGGVGT